MTNPKDKVLEDWDISRLKPYEKNAKIHTKEQIKKIAASIKRHGLVNPPHVEPDGTIITGHGRHMALMSELGWKVLPVYVRYDLTKAEAAALRIADNKVAEGQIDTNMLHDELRWLDTELDDLQDLGFDDRELAFLTEDIGSLNEDLLSTDVFSVAPGESFDSTDDVMAKADEARQPITKALGFKDVSTSNARVLSRFMATLKEKYGDDPEKSLMAFIGETTDE